MNYRHAYHAGNFADVLKHAVLALCIDYLKRKDAPFRVIDTHAGTGSYSLASVQAGRTQEWRAGIGRLLAPEAPPLPREAPGLVAPYLQAVRAENAGTELTRYPGSPRVALSLMRQEDKLIANELHPEDRASLKTALGRDRRAKVTELDGWVALRAFLPPKERRGIILIDPPFEQEGELARCVQGLAEGLERFATGLFIVWYPIKDLKPIEQFHSKLVAMDVRLLAAELMVRRPNDPDRLNGCGLLIANPPYTLEPALQILLPALCNRLRLEAGARHRLTWLDGSQIGTNVNFRRPRPIRSKR